MDDWTLGAILLEAGAVLVTLGVAWGMFRAALKQAQADVEKLEEKLEEHLREGKEVLQRITRCETLLNGHKKDK